MGLIPASSPELSHELIGQYPARACISRRVVPVKRAVGVHVRVAPQLDAKGNFPFRAVYLKISGSWADLNR